MLKISEILTIKRNYDFRKLIILMSDLMQDFCVIKVRANGYFILETRQVDLRKFLLYEIAEEFLRAHYFCDDSSKWRQH